MAEETTPPERMFDKLRSMVLKLEPKDIGLTHENTLHPVYAILMETGFPEGSFTLSSVADGSTSLYFSNGGGIIGGDEHDSVRNASQYFLTDAQKYFSKAKSVTSYPLPEPGMVNFYFISFNGIRSYSALEDSLGNEIDDLSNLFFSAHCVITELRKIDEK